jgi:hypothetical protein
MIMTHAIGRGTCNISLNVQRSEDSLLALVALRKKTSKSKYLRRILLIGLEADCPEIAAKLRAIRNAAYSASAAVLLLCGSVAQWITGDDSQQFRPVRIVRRAGGVRRLEEC